MKSFFVSVLIVSLSWMILPSVVLADTGSTDASGSAVKTETPLLVDSIVAQDDTHVLLTFNQNIVTESVRVRITRQSNGNNIKIASLTGVTDSPRSVSVIMSDSLEEGVAYTMIIVSAISDNAVIIRDGADALKEFTTPVPLKKSGTIVFNAPANKTTTTVATNAAPEKTNTVAANSTDTEKPVISNTNQELPLTGMNPMLFMIVAGVLALVLLLSRKKRA